MKKIYLIIVNFFGVTKFVFSFLFLASSSIYSFAQDYDMNVTKDSRQIADSIYTGYATTFRISANELQRSWWKYAKDFALLDKMKGYYIVKIPPKSKETLPVSLIEQVKGDERKATIFLALLEPSDTIFKHQVKNMLLEFKVSYYANIIAVQIKEKEHDLSSQGNKYQVLLRQEAKEGVELTEKKQKVLTAMNELEFELESLKRELSKIKEPSKIP